MANKSKKYSHDFLSQTAWSDVSYHGSPEWEPYQTICEEDFSLRKKVANEFGTRGFYIVGMHLVGSPEHGDYSSKGFDGKQNYFFGFREEVPREKNRGTEENISYKTIVSIFKQGGKSQLNELSDLEIFLTENGFKEVLSE